LSSRRRNPFTPRRLSGQETDEQTGAAAAASEAGISLEYPCHRIAADDLHSIGGIDGFRRIGAAVHGLIIVAMAEELRDRIGCDFDIDRSAAALDWSFALLRFDFRGRSTGRFHGVHQISSVSAS
jgi:hypothetical protein